MLETTVASISRWARDNSDFPYMIAKYMRMASLRAAGLRLMIFKILNTRPLRRIPFSYSCLTIPSDSSISIVSM